LHLARRSRRRILFGAETSRWVTLNRDEVLKLALVRRDSIRSEVSPCEDPSPLPHGMQRRGPLRASFSTSPQASQRYELRTGRARPFEITDREGGRVPSQR